MIRPVARGKILRFTTDGQAAPGNPFGTLVYSLGHRNPQGLAWDAEGRLWSAELGQNTYDELNLIEPGNNYGRPVCEGVCDDPEYTNPKATWTTAEASPSGLAIVDDTAFMGALRGQRLWRIELTGTEAGEITPHFQGTYGRIRAVVPGANEMWMRRGARRRGHRRVTWARVARNHRDVGAASASLPPVVPGEGWGMSVKRALLGIGLAVVLAACDSAPASPQETVPPPPDPREQFLKDVGLRDVRMATGAELRWVQPETASQILCQLLEEDEWAELLGGRVGRRAYVGPTATCHVFYSEGTVTVELSQSDDAIDPVLTIAGRPAEIDANGWYRVALTDEALEPAPRQYYPERRVLTVNVSADDPDTEPDLIEKVIEEIVPLVIEEGDPVPDADDQGYLRYEKTPLTGDFVDQPMPVQALQLCTLAREELDLEIRDVKARDDGDCRVEAVGDHFTIAALRVSADDTYPDRVAGRPARKTGTDPSAYTVLLQDGVGTGLWITGDDALGTAEKLIPLLAG